jgi:hypothetical protein
LTNLITVTEALGRADEVSEVRRQVAEFMAREPFQAAVAARLTAILKGQSFMDELERLELAYQAYKQALYAGSARLFAEAIASDSKIADDRQRQHRYNAACAAALAGSGQGKDEPPPDDAAKAKLRRQARDWLQAELTAWSKLLDSGPVEWKARIAPTMKHWKEDADLAGIRDEMALSKLPEDERAALKMLWNDVDQLHVRAAENKPPASR